ncbi:copper homeostasis membrane protein CopD [Photorhabdus temperata]|uniref:Copper resistance protein D n=1 Tax=Photorhabdus temperata subsp. temperata Meg1 TaxID=1393735 RepID=A0A081RZC9_PHOTE|nr:copper homeostasis membrane protein CopD [Photorhabdus temperata]KER04032.1 putative copper export protein [Photorhabdus temperata subsp. temperata Meg1]MCT8347676.1 copper homeostasis membrane protein CopD [Photorhabdus temperata]
MSLAALYTLCRFTHFVAVMLMFGFSIFTAMLVPDRLSVLIDTRLRLGVIISTIVALITAIGWLAMQAGIMADGWQDTYNLEIWLAVLGTTFGKVWQWQILASIVATGLLFINNPKTRNITMLIISAILLSCHAFIGHSVIHDGITGVFHQINQVIHLLSVGYWFGGLWPFLLCLQFWRIQNELAVGLDGQIMISMMRFSAYGHIAVILIIVTGTISSLILLPDWPEYSGSEYQSMLWIKIALVAGMVVLALINRYILVPKLRQPGRYQLLVINSWVEIMLGALALLCVAVFATYQPV